MASVPAEPRPCSIARTLDVVGEKWALLAVREVFLGNRRFDAMVHRTGAPRDTLAARLRTLVGAGVLERRQYSEHPARFEYHLTAQVVCEACGEPLHARDARPVTVGRLRTRCWSGPRLGPHLLVRPVPPV